MIDHLLSLLFWFISNKTKAFTFKFKKSWAIEMIPLPTQLNPRKQFTCLGDITWMPTYFWLSWRFFPDLTGSQSSSKELEIAQPLKPWKENNWLIILIHLFPFSLVLLSLFRGEILEILDSSRNWWKARNSRGQIAHVPNTIVEPISSNYQFNRSERGSRLTRGSPDEDWIRKERQGKKGEFRYF